MSDQSQTETVLKSLETIFAEELDMPDITLALSDNHDSVPAWDSLAHIRIMASIEAEYGFLFEMSELEELHDVGSIIAAITARR